MIKKGGMNKIGKSVTRNQWSRVHLFQKCIRRNVTNWNTDPWGTSLPGHIENDFSWKVWGLSQVDKQQRHNNWSDYALLAIDIQKDYWDSTLMNEFPHFEHNVAHLLQFCRHVGVDIFHIRQVFSPDKTDWLPRYRLRDKAPCIRDSHGCQPLDCARELEGETVLEKQSLDAFCNTPLESVLRTRGKKVVFTCGLATSMCVLLTTATAFQKGFLTAMIADCCADFRDAHETCLKRYDGFFEIIHHNQLEQFHPKLSYQLHQLTHHIRSQL